MEVPLVLIWVLLALNDAFSPVSSIVRFATSGVIVTLATPTGVMFINHVILAKSVVLVVLNSIVTFVPTAGPGASAVVALTGITNMTKTEKLKSP